MIGDGAAETAQLSADGRILGGSWPPQRPEASRWAGQFLGQLDTEARAAVLSVGAGNAIAAGGLVPIVVGQVVVLLSGWVKATASSENGRSFMLAIHHAGEVVDVGALAAPGQVRVTAGALTLIRRIPAGAFAVVLDAYPSVREAYCRAQCMLLRRTTRQWVTSLAPVRVRVARTLTELHRAFAGRQDAVGHVRIPLSQQEIAHLADGSLPAVHRELTALRQVGIIAVPRRRCIVIVDVPALLAVAGTTAPLATHAGDRRMPALAARGRQPYRARPARRPVAAQRGRGERAGGTVSSGARPDGREAGRLVGLTLANIEQVRACDLRAALVFASARTARVGMFSAVLVAARLRAPAAEVGHWLEVLAVIGLLTRFRTAGGSWAYACQPQLAAVPAGDAARSVDDVTWRELWAALRAAQLPTGTASGEDVAVLLDARAGQVDRVDVTLRLAVLAAGGLLRTCSDGAQGWRWQMTHLGVDRSQGLPARGLTDPEVWAAFAADRPADDADLDVVTAARRLGVSTPRLEGWCDRQTRTGYFARSATGLRLTEAGWAAVTAVPPPAS